MLSPSIEKLIKIFSQFPTVGPKTAGRFVFYLLQSPALTSQELIKSIQELKEKTKSCSLCHKIFEGQNSTLCEICSNPIRDKSIICIVEKEIDLEAIEKTNQYKGLYFILNNILSIMKKEITQQDLETKVNQLSTRIKQNSIREIILAINPTLEGQNTMLWLKRKLKPLGVKITQLAKGIPLGGEIEYADEETITSALQGRNWSLKGEYEMERITLREALQADKKRAEVILLFCFFALYFFIRFAMWNPLHFNFYTVMFRPFFAGIIFFIITLLTSEVIVAILFNPQKRCPNYFKMFGKEILHPNYRKFILQR